MTGALSLDALKPYQQLIVSPGIALATPALQAAIESGVEIVGDIELFLRDTATPVIAITGSNGKSTVTRLVAALLEQAGKTVHVGGNIGIPALDLLSPDTPRADFVVLELSSFQLETTASVNAAAAALLNLCEDHMDRYQGMDDYLAAKQRIFHGCQHAVVNLDDAASVPVHADMPVTGFSVSAPEDQHFGLISGEYQRVSGSWIVQGEKQLVHSSCIALKGRHNLANVMAALALVQACGVEPEDTVPALRDFHGLSHRCQFVDRINGVEYINDSKGTNVGSTIAAVDGLAPDCSGTLHVLLGGDGKGQDFTPLVSVMQQYTVKTYVFGAEAGVLARLLAGSAPCFRVGTLDEAFQIAHLNAVEGDSVLLSPACASFDQFVNYMERGHAFERLVRSIA